MTVKKRNLSLSSSESSSELVRDLIDIMKKLRSKKGCPWDREQTHQSLKKYLIEECAEFLDAVDDNDDDGMKEEIGDVLLHVIFHCQIASERGAFNFNDVVHSLCAKLRRRHPHVFGNSRADSSKEVLKIWNDVKKIEGKNDNSEVSGLRHFPALFRAEEVQKKAAKVGFDWENEKQILEKIKEEVCELEDALITKNKSKIEDELGDLLFSIVNLARFLKGKSAEEILAKTTRKFQNRFRFIEQELRKKSKSPSKKNLSEMEKLWQKAKKIEKN